MIGKPESDFRFFLCNNLWFFISLNSNSYKNFIIFGLLM